MKSSTQPKFCVCFCLLEHTEQVGGEVWVCGGNGGSEWEKEWASAQEIRLFVCACVRATRIIGRRRAVLEGSAGVSG